MYFKIYKNIFLRFVFYGCETLSLALREERRLKVLGNRVLRRIFGPRRAEVTRGVKSWKLVESFRINIPLYCRGDNK